MRRTFRVKAALAGSAVAIAGVATGCVYNTPAVGGSSGFNDVATLSKTDVWAVGSTADKLGDPSRALIEHFDGTRWTIVAAPSTAGATLTSITAVSATDVWAVGGGHTLHWDGRSWSAASDPAGLVLVKVEHGHGGLVMGLAVNTSSNAVEVVSRTATSWQPIDTPTPPLPTSGRPCDAVLALNAMTLLTTSDIWVAGGTHNSGSSVTSECPYAAHWDGSSWTTYAIPNVTGKAVSALTAISARDTDSVWAVGQAHYVDPKSGALSNPGFAVRWNGAAPWQTLCNFGCGPISWTDIDATGPNVWATGVQVEGNGYGDVMGISRWVGNGWASQPVQQVIPAPLTYPGNFLTSVSARGGAVTSAGFFLGVNTATRQTTSTPLVDVRDDK